MKMRLSSVLSHSVVICLFIIVSHVHSQASANYRLSNNIAPSIYDLHITIDLDGLHFAGVETILAHASQNTSIIELHALDLTIYNVQVTENGIDLPFNSLVYINETQTFRITLDQSLMPNSDFQLKLEFSGEIRDDMKGLYRSSYYENRLLKYMATTFSAAAYARKIFPCFDEPAFKAEFRLTITNKNNFVTLANTAVKNISFDNTNDGTVWKTVEFEPTPVMSTYLVAFAAAEFSNLTTSEADLEFSVYSSQNAINNMKYALDIGRKALKELEAYVGHNYTLSKMDFIAIDDFLMGAMENWGLISFKSSRIMNPDGKRNYRKVQEITNIITHELVHMFFGNQVTCEYWDYVWLNEGFASYLEQVIADKILPNWRILDYFLVDRMHGVMLQDVQPKTHPMTRPINTPDEISKIYDFVAYPKAASVIRMIEHIMTPEIFQKSLEFYIAERSFSTATDEQLYEVFERTRRMLSTANYPPIPEVFRTWAKNPGFPILNVEFNRVDKTAKVSQERFVPFINSTASSEFYILYNYAASSSAGGFGDTTPTNWIRSGSEVEHSLERLTDDERWVVFNVQQTGYYRVNYDIRNWIAIIDELNSERYDSIHTLNRAQLLDDSFNLARYDYLNFNITLSLIEYLHRETELIPLTAGFKAVEFMMTFLDQEDFYKDLRAFLLGVVDKVYVNINSPSFPVTPDDSDYHVLRKLHVNSFACKIGADSCLKDATMKLFLFDYDYNTLEVNERPYLYCGVLNSDLATYNWDQLRRKLIQRLLWNEESIRENQEEINEIFHALSTCDKNVRRIEMLLNDVFLHSSEIMRESYENISKENALQVVGNLIKTSSAHRAALMSFYMINFEVVNAKVPFKETLSMFAEAINTKEHLEHFQTLARLANHFEQDTVETIEENIRWLTYKKSDFSNWEDLRVNGAVELKTSILAISVFIFVLLVK